MKRAQTNDEGIVAGPSLLQQAADAPSAFGRERASHQRLQGHHSRVSHGPFAVLQARI